MAAPKHPRRYYNVTVGTDGDPEIYTHMSKLNVANIVKMALDTIEDAPATSLYVTIDQEPESVTKMLNSTNAGRKRYER